MTKRKVMENKLVPSPEQIVIIVLLLMQVYLGYLLKEGYARQVELSKVVVTASGICSDSVRIVSKAAEDALALIKKAN